MVLNKNVNKYGIIIIVLGFLVLLYAIFLFPHCNGSPSDCIVSRESLFSDFNWHYNIIKFVAENGVLPVRAETSPGIIRPAWHGPLYYYLSAIVYLFARITNLNNIILLHIFSAIITLFTNIMFFLLLKNLSKHFKNKHFVIYSLALFVFLPTSLYLSLFTHPSVLFYFFLIASLYACVRFNEKKDIKNAVLLGTFAGLGMLASVNALIIHATIFVYLVIKHIKRKYRERNLLLVSFCISVFLGLYPLIRNYLLYNNLFGDLPKFPTKFINLMMRLFTAFWGGIFGGNDYLYVPIGIMALTISLLTVFGIMLYYRGRKKDIGLDFLILMCLINMIGAVYWSCRPLILIETLTCKGTAVLGRYLLPIMPLIAIFSTITLLKLQKKKYVKKAIWIFISISCTLFVIDFIWAFI